MGRDPHITPEQRILSLEKRLERLYQWTYATHQRRERKHARNRAIAKLQRQALAMDKVMRRYRTMGRRLAAIFEKRRPGTKAVYLSRREINKLTYWLARDFRKEGT